MPNGAIIFHQLSSCPADAIRAEQRDTPLPNPVTPFKHRAQPAPDPPNPQPAPRAAAAAPVTAPPAQTPPTKPRDIINEAYGLCVLLKAAGATDCKVEVNIFSPSYIDATVPTSIRDAQMVCLHAASLTRQPGSPFIGQNWNLKLFSPLGAGTRPIASCKL